MGECNGRIVKIHFNVDTNCVFNDVGNVRQKKAEEIKILDLDDDVGRGKNNKTLARLWKRADESFKRKIEGMIIFNNRKYLYMIANKYLNNMEMSELKGDLINELASFTLRKTLDTFEESRGLGLLTWWSYQIHGKVSHWLRYGDIDIFRLRLKGLMNKNYCKECNQDEFCCFECNYNKGVISSGEDLENHYPIKKDYAVDNGIDVEKILNSRFLDKKEKFVVKCYYIDDLTLQQIGMLLRITRERVRQIKRNALNKLQTVYVREMKK